MHFPKQFRSDAKAALECFRKARRWREANANCYGFQGSAAGQQHASGVKSRGLDKVGRRFARRRHEFAIECAFAKAGAVSQRRHVQGGVEIGENPAIRSANGLSAFV